jgi:hypothetical protein
LVTPSTVIVAAVELARVQVPASVTVTTLLVVVAVVVTHVPAKPDPYVTVGDAGTVKDPGKAIEMVSPAERAPPDEVEKPCVQLATDPALEGDPVKDTEVTAEPVAVIETADAGETAETLSSEVLTEKPAAG